LPPPLRGLGDSPPGDPGRSEEKAPFFRSARNAKRTARLGFPPEGAYFFRGKAGGENRHNGWVFWSLPRWGGGGARLRGRGPGHPQGVYPAGGGGLEACGSGKKPETQPVCTGTSTRPMDGFFFFFGSFTESDFFGGHRGGKNPPGRAQRSIPCGGPFAGRGRVRGRAIVPGPRALFSWAIPRGTGPLANCCTWGPRVFGGPI